jgi:drug/metabolite transporter (DMT)-like permease
MSLIAIAGLLFAAMLHAIWNLFAKRSIDNQTFLIGAVALSTVMLAPLALPRLHPIPPAAWGIIVLSAALESTYYVLLGKAYKGGDLSLVYPISRGSSPMFVTLLAVFILGERIAPIGLFGILLTVAGIYVVHLKSFAKDALLEPFRAIAKSRTSQLALLTGMTIAGYSAVDKVGVGMVDPVLYIFLVFSLSIVMLSPFMWLKKREALRIEWRANWRTMLLVGAMIAGGYLLILIILSTNKVSYATSVRSASVVFGALLGLLVLKEPLGDKKLLGACVIFAGIICIGFAS